ncbi:TetR/AcrR family transcriptional regulator [uncultured Roseobacter sp.]|uniref:TetR/AcrR family transcriptional regulator n=1 Tax=uncultured Roseobacter sp. TaxID=114847 RepID=UPI0026105D71|nr:TetR/AcrR family transcriptional regulator [uncultured Roseobacter sp.]
MEGNHISVTIDTKRKGRPREFDEVAALDAAMQVFWIKGYDGASMKDLTKAMGINSPSLYAGFGDKRELYLKAIEHYTENYTSKSMRDFEEEEDIEKAVRSYLLGAIERGTMPDPIAKGCFLASSVATSSGEVEGAKELLLVAINDTDHKFELRFEAAKKQGALPADFPSKSRAHLLSDLRLGHAFRARAGADKETLTAEVDQQVRSVLA